jgi:phosphate transport system substrate-binding protein
MADFSSRNLALSVSLRRPFGPPQGRLDPNLAAFLDGTLSFAFLSRELADADRARFRCAHGADPLTIPVAAGAWDAFGYVDPVVVIVNEANPARTISFSQLDAIFSASHWHSSAMAVEWGAAGVAAWRGRPIHIVGANAWMDEESARAISFRRAVLDDGTRHGRWRPAPGSGGENEVVDRVAADRLAIGFTGFGHVRPGVKVLALRRTDTAPPIAPTRATIVTARYPLARTVDLLLAPGPRNCIAPDAARLVSYLLSVPGQAIVARIGPFLPLSPGQRRASLRLVRACT